MSFFDLLVCLLYFGGFSVLTLGIALLPADWRLAIGVPGFFVLQMACISWAMAGADGPAGLGLLAIHGFMQWVLLLILSMRGVLALMRAIARRLSRDRA